MSFWQWVAERVSPFIDTTIHNRLTSLEDRMSKIDEAFADLDVATTEVADELDELHGRLVALDADLAQRLHEKADRLRSLASDPENPVPDLVPQTPAPEVPGVQAGADVENQTGTSGVAGIGNN